MTTSKRNLRLRQLFVLAPNSLQVNFSRLLLRGHRIAFPICAISGVLGGSCLWALKPPRLTLAMAGQATPRAVGLDGGVFRRKVMTATAFGPKLYAIQDPVAGDTKGYVVLGVNAIHAIDLLIKPQPRLGGFRVKCSLNALRRAAPDTNFLDQFSCVIVNPVVRRGRTSHDSIIPAGFIDGQPECAADKEINRARVGLQTCQGRAESMIAIRRYLLAYTAARSARFEGAA